MANGSPPRGAYQLDISRMNHALECFDTALAELGQNKAVLESTVSSLLAHWEGRGRLAFEQEYGMLLGQLRDLEDAMADMRRTLATSEARYRESGGAIGGMAVNG